MKTKILFVCTGNLDRSPTAEAVYKDHPALEVKSAGTSRYANTTVKESLIEWADIVIVMERVHEDYIRTSFSTCTEKPIYCLNIPDNYPFMNSELVAMIKRLMKQLNDEKKFCATTF